MVVMAVGITIMETKVVTAIDKHHLQHRMVIWEKAIQVEERAATLGTERAMTKTKEKENSTIRATVSTIKETSITRASTSTIKAKTIIKTIMVEDEEETTTIILKGVKDTTTKSTAEKKEKITTGTAVIVEERTRVVVTRISKIISKTTRTTNKINGTKEEEINGTKAVIKTKIRSKIKEATCTANPTCTAT